MGSSCTYGVARLETSLVIWTRLVSAVASFTDFSAVTGTHHIHPSISGNRDDGI